MCQITLSLRGGRRPTWQSVPLMGYTALSRASNARPCNGGTTQICRRGRVSRPADTHRTHTRHCRGGYHPPAGTPTYGRPQGSPLQQGCGFSVGARVALARRCAPAPNPRINTKRRSKLLLLLCYCIISCPHRLGASCRTATPPRLTASAGTAVPGNRRQGCCRIPLPRASPPKASHRGDLLRS